MASVLGNLYDATAVGFLVLIGVRVVPAVAPNQVESSPVPRNAEDYRELVRIPFRSVVTCDQGKSMHLSLDHDGSFGLTTFTPSLILEITNLRRKDRLWLI